MLLYISLHHKCVVWCYGLTTVLFSPHITHREMDYACCGVGKEVLQFVLYKQTPLFLSLSLGYLLSKSTKNSTFGTVPLSLSTLSKFPIFSHLFPSLSLSLSLSSTIAVQQQKRQTYALNGSHYSNIITELFQFLNTHNSVYTTQLENTDTN